MAPAYGLPALKAFLGADPGKKDPEIIIDFRDGPHGGAGVFAGGLLFDGDGGGKPPDGVVFGFFHLADELPGIGGKGFHIPALALGKDGVKGQAGLAGPGDTGEHHHLFFGDVDVDIFEIVFPGPPDNDPVKLFGTRFQTCFLPWPDLWCCC